MASDKALIRAASRQEKDHRKQIEAGLRHLVSRKEGRVYLWHLLGQTGLFNNPHNSNALNTAFACGEQNIGQKILADLTDASPEALLQMMKESQDDDRIRTAALERTAAAAAAGDGTADTDDDE